MGHERTIPGRLQSSPGGSLPPIHLLRVSRCHRGASTQWLDRCSDCPGGNLSSILPAADWGTPFWNTLRGQGWFQAALRGINAAVVGLLLAALYQPVWTSTIKVPVVFVLALGAFGLLVFWKWPPGVVVLLSAGVGVGLSLL